MTSSMQPSAIWSRFTTTLLTGMAEYYSAELSEKVVRGMTENVLKGKYNGGTVPIGFKVDEEKFFQIDPLKAPFVVEAFQKYDDGISHTKSAFSPCNTF